MIIKIYQKIKCLFEDYHEFQEIIKKINILFSDKMTAIVGSASNILDRENGELIDSYNLVVRFNGAPTENYEQFAGKKTDVIVCTNIFLHNVEHDLMIKENKDPFFIKKQKNKIIFVIMEENAEYIKKNIFNLVDKSNVVIFFDNRLNYILRFYLISKYNILKKILFSRYGCKLSSGLIFVSILDMLKIKFSSFGFDLNKNVNNMNYYYYKPRRSDHMHTAHDFKMENKILKKLLNLKS